MNQHLPSLVHDVQNASVESRAEVPVVEAHALLGKAGLLVIVHGGDTYQLTRTKQNKLLLTKCVPSAQSGQQAPR